MNNPVDIAITNILQFIPRQVLEVALSKHMELGLEHAITEKILVEKVIKNCNIGGGKTVMIPLLENYAVDLTDEIYAIYRIPQAARDNRNIIEVHRVQYDPKYRQTYFAHQSGAILNTIWANNPFNHASSIHNAQGAMLTSKTGVGGSARTPHVELLQGDMIRLSPSPRTHIPWFLTCRLAYDNSMLNLNSEAILAFSELSVLSAKIHCYNNIIVNLDIGHIDAGWEISSIKDIVSKWSDLEEQYSEKLHHFFALAAFDIQRLGPIVAMML
jgi:hypothetical protein